LLRTILFSRRRGTENRHGGLVAAFPAVGSFPGDDYRVLADCGIVGELIDDPALETEHLARVRYLGAVCADRGETANIRQFALTRSSETDRNTPVYLLLGTSGDVGKTTAGVAVLRALRMKGHTTVVALKATGTHRWKRSRDTGISGRRSLLIASISVSRPPIRRVVKGSATSSPMRSISASLCLPKPWWWNAAATCSVPMCPTFLPV
jgi:hypothetical protein